MIDMAGDLVVAGDWVVTQGHFSMSIHQVHRVTEHAVVVEHFTKVRRTRKEWRFGSQQILLVDPQVAFKIALRNR